jgi:hypothetical protein
LALNAHNRSRLDPLRSHPSSHSFSRKKTIERAVRLEVLRLRFQQVSPIGEDVQPHWRGPRCVEVYPLYIAAGE